MNKKSAVNKNARVLNSNYKISGFDLQNIVNIVKFTKSPEKNNAQIKIIEKDLNAWLDNTLSVFSNYNDPENKKEWESTLTDLSDHFQSIIQLLISTTAKMEDDVKTDHLMLWNAIDSRIHTSNKTIKKMELISKDQMTIKDYVCFSNEIKHFELIILPYIIAFVDLCKVELT